MANTSSDAVEAPTHTYLRIGLLGFVAGLRSMTPLALLSWTRRIGVDTDSTVSHFIDAPSGRLITGLLAAGELVGDKLPITPSRISAGPLMGRIVVGGLAGATISQGSRVSPVVGAALGAAAASAGAVAGYYGRQSLTRIKWVPGFVWAGLEDSLALGLGFLATRRDR